MKTILYVINNESSLRMSTASVKFSKVLPVIEYQIF